MISFRYHIVTIVAVFLALGLGVLAGTTVIDQQIMNGLRTQITEANQEVTDLRVEVDTLTAAGERHDSYIDSSTEALVQDRLVGSRVVLVTQEGVDPASLQETRTALSDAGAEVVAGLSTTGRMMSRDIRTRKELATIVGGQADDPPEELAELAAVELGRRLASGESGERDVLRDLLEQGFVVPAGNAGVGENDLSQIGGPGQSVVVVTGGKGEPWLPTGAFVTPLTEALVAGGARVAVGEAARSEHDAVVDVRINPALDGRIVTVDDLDERLGGVALVLGLHQLQVSGEGGNYGSKQGASGLLPQG